MSIPLKDTNIKKASKDITRIFFNMHTILKEYTSSSDKDSISKAAFVRQIKLIAKESPLLGREAMRVPKARRRKIVQL